jgi:hypothetical protein
MHIELSKDKRYSIGEVASFCVNASLIRFGIVSLIPKKRMLRETDISILRMSQICN